MSLAVDIPKIELTSENEDDDYDPNNLNFIDALTDVEDLYDDHVNQKPKNEPKKFKLKIKLNDDGGATDLEDFEASDNEDNDKIIKHSKPVLLDELDLECGTFEETYKTQLKNVKGKKKLRTQFSTTKKDDKHSLRLEKDTDGGLTDVENFDTEDEDAPAPDIPDININLDLYRNDDINISEKLSEENIDCPNKLQCKNKQFLSALSMSPNLSDITDVEIIDSDSDDGGRKKRSCKGRRRRARFNQDPVTDAEDLEVSDRECAFTRKISKKPRSKTTSCLKNRSQSLPYDSDNDDNRDLPFPICKKIAVKNQTSLQVPEFDTQILTDTEDFEGDVPFTTAAMDEEALDQKLMDIAAGYGQVQEKHNLVKGKRQYYSESYKDEPNLPQPNENNTDVDECETDSEDRIDDYNEEESYGIKFTDNEIKSVQRQTKTNKLIVPLNEDNDALTDLENINSSSEDEFSKTMPLALVKKNSSLTDEEDFQGDPSELVEEVPEITLPPAIRNLILLQDNEGNIPTIKILPLDESHLVGTAKIACGTATDEEYFSDAEEITESYHRPATPDLPLMDGGLTNVVENMHKSLSSITIPDTIAESRTDTEEIVMEDVTKRRRAPKFKTFKKFLNVEKQDATVLTDTEEIYLEDNLSSLNLIPVPNNNEGTTDVENLDTSDSEAELKSIRPLSCTPQHMRELGGEYILSKENSGPISVKDRSNINKRLPQIQNTTASPMYTDTEDLIASADEEYISYSRAVTATPNQIHIDLDQMSSSRVHTELTRKFDPDAPDEVMYLKGGGFIDRDTEIEDISDDEHVKIHSEVALNIKDGIVSFGFKKELDAPRKQIQLVSPERSIVEEDAVQDVQSVDSRFITYESVLLTPNRNMSLIPPSVVLSHKSTSYTQIDAMLEKMLFEVDKQEKLFGLDLDVLEPEEQCVNTLELLPSSDALIEIPIKKSIRKPKVYETVQNILIDDQDPPLTEDLINFEEPVSSGVQLDAIAKTIDNLLVAVEDDEACMLLSEDFLEKPYKYDYPTIRTASSESLSDNYPDSWNDSNDNYMDDSYETIESNPLKYAYQLRDNRTGDDIWWEGTYRNLSIVPEEDEENASLLGSYSSRTYISKPFLKPDLAQTLFKEPSLDSSKSSSSSSVSTSSDEGHYETFEKVVKAEVKLLVKTSDKGKEEIEIRSVREFMDAPAAQSVQNVNIKSKTLPNKLSDKFNSITNKFSSFLEVNKNKTACYSLLPAAEKSGKSDKSKSHKPSFTLPRLFIRTPEADVLKKAGSENNLLKNKELSKSRTELIAMKNERFPLHYDLESPQTENKVDLYANKPFYPCYNQYTTIPIQSHSPNTEFISNPFKDNSSIPQAYCDWCPEKECLSGGIPTSTSQYLASTEESLTGLPIDINNIAVNSKFVTDHTNALIQSESRAEPYHALTEKHYKIQKDDTEDDEKQDSCKTDSLKEEKKQKKGFLGTLKTFVGKSLDHSDSDSEKSGKKSKKTKKDKKKKKKDREVPQELPVRPPRKPKLPTPTEERKEFDDIPFVETASISDEPPHYQPPEVPVEDDLKLPSIPVTDLDENEVPIEIKEQATEIVTEVIKNGEYAVADYIKKSPKKEKRKKVTIVEEKITKTLQPLVIEQEEFTIVIDPTKSETPKKSRETFTLNIDETIGQIESEIMQKSPILSEETILKPLVYDEPPKRPQRIKDHIYEDIDDPVVSHPPDNLVSLPQNIKLGYESADEKLEDKVFTAPPVVTKEEVTVTEKGDSQKMKRKHNKLFGLFSKSSKDADDSDEDSRKEIIEKQDKEGSKETEDKKSGFLGMFQKKPKKDEAVAEKPALSDETVKNMKESTDFLLKEVEKYEDVKPITFEMVTKSDIIQETAEKDEAAGKKEKSETGLLGKFKKSKKDDETKVSKEVEKLLAENEEANLPHPPSENTLLNMITTSKFIQEEVDKYHDVYPVIPEKPAEATPTAEVKIEEETPAKGGIFGLFAKKKSQEREIEVKKEEKIDPLTEKLLVVEKVEEKVIEKEEEKTTEKPSGGILGIFAKKPKKDKGKRDSSVEKLKETTSPEKKIKSEPVLLVEPIQKTLTDTTNFINTEINNYEDAKIEPVKTVTVEEEPVTEEITKVVTEKVEPDTTPKEKEGFFGFFKKDKSPKREPVITTVTTTTVTKEIITAQELTEKMSELIGKDIILIEQDIDIKSEQIPKDIESTTEVETKLIPSEKLVKEMSDTTKFISEELTNYEDAKPTFKKELSVEKEKKTGILGLFGKRKSQERELPDEKPSDEKKDRQERRKSGSPFRIFGKKQKSEEEPKKVELTEETLQHITDSDNFLNQEIESYEDAKLKTITEAENIVPSAPIILSEQTKTEMKESHEFLSTEQSNYEDAKNELVTDLDEDSDVKSSGLFGIFSKKDKKDSPKTTKKKYKKHKHEKSLEDTEKVGFIEKLGRKLASSGSDAKDQIEEATEKMKDEIAEENAKFEAEITDTIKESENIIDGAKSSITKTKESAKQKQVAFKDKTEDILTITDDKITAVITTVEDIQLAADKNVVEAVEEATVSAETQLKNVAAEAEKKKGFFGKLGDKLSGKSEDLIDSVIDTTKSIEEEAVTKKSVITEKVKDVSDEIAQNGSKVIEEITQSTIDTTDSLKRDVLDVTKDSKEIIESTKKDAQKKTKKGFFTKLGGKLSGKSEDLKDEIKDIKVKSDKIEDSIKSEVETAKANLDKDAKEIEGQIKSEITATTTDLEEKAEAVKAESSNFVAEIMDSFDKHLEYVKDEEEDLKKDAEEQVKKRQDAIDTFRQSIDEKFSDTMKLSEEIIEERSHIVKETVSDAKKELDLTIKEELETIDKLDHDTQLQIEKTFTENLEEAAAVPAQIEKKSEDLQKDAAEFLVKETEKLKDETEKASKKSSGFFSKLGDKISGKAKETEKKMADTGKQYEEAIIIAKDDVKKDISDATEKVVDESKQTITRIESKEKEISEQAKEVSEAAVKDSKEFIGKQTKEGKGFFEKLGVKITGKSKDAQKAAESVKDDVVKATTDTLTDVDNKIKKQDKDLKKEESKIIEQAAEIQKDGKEVIEEVVTEIKQDYTTVEAAVTGTVSDTLDKAVTAKDNLKQDLIDVETKGKENLQAVKDASEDAVKDSKEFIGKQAKESKGFFEKISDKISGKSKDAQKATETAKDDLIKAATDIDDKVKKQTDELVKAEAKLVEKSVEIQKDGKEALDKVAADVKEEAKKEYTAAETAITESVSVTLDQAATIKDDLKENIQSTSEQTKQISEKAIKDSQELITKQTKESKGFFEKIGDKISGKSKDAQKATESVKEDLTKAAIIVDDKVKEQTEILIKEEAKVVEKAAEIQKESREAMEKIAADAKDELKQAETIITEKVSVTVDQAKSIKESLKEDLINIEIQGKENIQLVSQQTKEAVKESEELISKQLKETKDTITTVVTEQISDPAQEMLKKSKEVADKQAVEVKEIFEKMGDKISDKSKDVQKSAEVLAADLTKSTDETLIKIDDKIEHHKEQLKKEEDKLVEEAAQMKENTKQALEDVKSSFTDKLNSLSGKVDEETKEADKKIQDLKDAVKDSNLLLQEEILVKDEELNEAINNRVSEILVDVSTKKKEIETILLEEAHATKIVPEQLLTQSQKSLQAKGDTIKSAIKSAITKKTSLSDKTKESLLETAEKTETTTIEASSKAIDEAEEKVEKVSKKSKSFLGKLGRKLSGKGDELKPKKQPEVKQEEAKQESEKKSKKGSGFFGKLGEKLSSKTDEVKQDVTEVQQDITAAAEEKLVVKVEQVKQEAASLKDQATDAVQKIEKELEKKSEELQTKAENVEKVLEQKNADLKTKIEDVEKEFKATVSSNVKQQTSDFLDDLRDNAMTRTISDNYGLADNQSSDTMKVSEANIDLSNLPTNLNKYPHTSQKHDSSSYVTSPTLARRTVSQRLSTGERPAFIELTNLESDLSDTDDSYIVTEPEEKPLGKIPVIQGIIDSSRKPLFHFDSEEDDSYDQGKLQERRASVQSNVLDSLTEHKIDNLLSDLTKNLDDATCSSTKVPIIKEEEKLEQHVLEAKVDVDIIEQKLRDLDQALDSLEQIEVVVSNIKDDEAKSEKKLRRVERKFERMASQTMDKEKEQAKAEKLSTPEVEEKRETEFQRLVSQLSTEEVSDFQKEYSHLWDENTFSKSEDWESTKTPDSQADAQDLPQGEIVYMGPVNLNKDHIVNKAGIEVDVIPIMRSPCPSPKPKKKQSKRAKSEMGFYRTDKHVVPEDDHGSLPDLKSSPIRRSILSTVKQMNPNRFLTSSNESLVSSMQSNEQRMSRSLGSTDSLPKGTIMSAVVNWLQTSSPFSSTDNLDQKSVATSVPDTMESSMSIFDEEDSLEISIQCSDERSQSKSDKLIPEIFVFEDELDRAKIETTSAPLTTTASLTIDETKIVPQPKPRLTKTPDTQLDFAQTKEEIKSDKVISPVRDDLLDEDAESMETYSDKKKFWENVTKETAHKRMSLHEVSTTESEVVAKKRTSIHEITTMPPVPKPRSLQSSVSLPEEDESNEKMSVKDRAISFESTGSGDSSGLVHTDLTRISESDSSLHEEKIMTEYQASFMAPTNQKPKPIKQEVEIIKSELKREFEKTDSLDSDVAQKGSSLLCENSGYISDSEDVEQYISDSEIEDRVPQIRERQMSVFAPPVATRKTIYERSASLPTEDMYEVSARSIKLRKQYYEEQIKKEMIEEQLTSEVEDEASPERKALLLEEEKETPKTQFQSIQESFEDKISDLESEEEVVPEKQSVKDLAKGYEKQLGSVVAGQKIGQSPLELKGFVLDRKIVETKTEHQIKDIEDFMEMSRETHKPDDDVTHNTESQFSISPQTHSETHKEIEIDSEEKLFQSQRSVSSDRSDPNYIEDSLSKPDSMEVHVDKSEIEDSEKLAELDQDATDFETKSIDSEISPKTLFFSEEHIPEITVTLSEKQRRISEESDEYAEKETVQAITPVTEKSECESPINQPEEHIQDTVWEVSVQSQPEQEFLENVVEIIETKSATKHHEKEEDLSSSVREESDLGSEIHQDHSDSGASDKIKSESQNDIEKIILDSLYQQRVDPEEAKKIATALIGEIEAEVQKRESCILSGEDLAKPEQPKTQVSEYLRHLAETKGLDEREVELVESVLARRQRELAKLTRGDTQASSMEITDEDLRYSGGELDYTHILEQQIDQLEAEKVDDIHLEYDSIEQDAARQQFHDKTGFVNKMDEEHSEERRSSQDYESYDNSRVTSTKRDSQSKTSESMKAEKTVMESRDVIFEEDETVSESAIEETEKQITHVEEKIQDLSLIKSDKEYTAEKLEGKASTETTHKSEAVTKSTEVSAKDKLEEKLTTAVTEEDTSKFSLQFEADSKKIEKFDDTVKETQIKSETTFDELCKKEGEIKKEQISTSKKEDDGTEVQSTTAIDSIHSKVSQSSTTVNKSHEETTSVTSKVLTDVTAGDLEKFMLQEKLAGEKEFVIKSHEIIKRTSSSDSKSSLESAKSPEDQFSTCSSGRKGDSSEMYKSPEKEKVVFRKTKPEVDTSSSSSNMKQDRKSGVEFETYSSSGESHYQSFELDSAKSRPCSSDVEGLFAANSSEYESALTSQEVSGRSHISSTEYQTAVSSLSSKESMKSLDSESSGNLASIEVSEVSETLVPSTSDGEGDILDMVDNQLLEDVEHISWPAQKLPVRQSTDVSDELMVDENKSIDVSEEDNENVKGIDIQSKMKRSGEMIFQPEPKMLQDSPPTEGQDAEEKYGTSLDDGSVLSMSVSSTSSTGMVRTVIELSRADSERLEGSMTVSGTSEQLSIEDMDNFTRGSHESLTQTPTPIIATDMSTSTPHLPTDLPIDSVTITTSSIDENGIQSVSTQVTSETHSPVDEFAEATIKVEAEEPKKRGHRRQDSTSAFVPMFNIASTTTIRDVDMKLHSDLAESDKYQSKLSFKEVSSDEKKDVDESEKEESYETEADQGFHRDIREGRYLDTESDNDVENLDSSRPPSHLSKSDSERPASTGLSDSELAELALRSLDTNEDPDPIERPISPEPCDETKDDTPELSSEAQASVGELEQEYSAAVSRLPEVPHFEHRRSLTKDSPDFMHKEPLEKRDSHGKSSSTSSEKSSFEEAEAEAAFSMVAHISPAHKIKQICPILEDEDAEKHELETRERAQKEFEKRRSLIKDHSPGFIPDIKITEHLTPLVDSNFTYPDLELEAKEKEMEAQTPETPASNTSKSSEETDQGREYILEDNTNAINEEPSEPELDTTAMTESKSEIGTVVEATLREESDKGTDSPNSDSFEMLEKPDLIDDFVVIEEVAKEAHEFDAEGKSVKIEHGKRKKKHDEEVEEYLVKSAPTPLTKMTDIKYYPDGSSSDELGFEFEDSPPQANQKSKKDYGQEYDQELEANKQWIEQQFQGDQAAMIAAGYGYEMDFERGPLEDIKEEDINDFDPTSSRIGSLGSQKNSGGSLGSVKDSYSSTPEYDVLAGRKYFSKSGDHDDVSMSSLQEFESLEQAMSLEMKKYQQGSQDSSSNGSFKSRYLANKSTQGDDISVSSLKEFEGLENACLLAHKIEIKVKEEEALLAQIDEAPESLASESESCETVSAAEKKLTTESDEEDYEKRMFEIDEIIKQAQTNVERFIDLKEPEKTESLGRGDSIEEVSKVPDLDLDAPVKSTVKVQWKEGDDVMVTSTDSLDLKPEKRSQNDSTDSLDQKTGVDIMTASTDSIEFQAQKSNKDNIMTDSIEIRDEKSHIVSSDSLELCQATSSANVLLLSDSIDEDGSRIGVYDHSSSSTGKDFSSSVREDEARADLMQGSTESLDPTSSKGTHATYQYETDSIFSGSFTSGGSNTMVSSTDTIDPLHGREAVDVAAAVRKVWFDEDMSGKYMEDTKPYVTEIIEPCDEESFSHTVHRRVEMPPEVRKITFTGADAEERLKKYIQEFGEGEAVQETEEVDAAGNVHVKKVVQKRFVVDSGTEQPMSGLEIDEYFKQLNQQSVQGQGVITRTVTDGQGIKTTFTQQFDIPQSQLTTLTTSVAGEGTSSTTQHQPEPRRSSGSGGKAETEEGHGPAKSQEHLPPKSVSDQHQLSDEMKQLLQELEKESKQ